MTDTYTKFLLTLIAVFLGVIAFRGAISPAHAGPEECGSHSFSACHVTIDNWPR